MDKKVVMWIVIAILAIAVVFMTIKTMNTGAASSVGQAASQVATQTASSGMVGGC